MTAKPRENNTTIRVVTKHVRRLIRVVIGFTVLLIGLAMIFLPGPAIVVIPFGLAILATEFVWAKKLMKRLTDGANIIRKNFSGGHSD